jgi:hypothetical protein
MADETDAPNIVLVRDTSSSKTDALPRTHTDVVKTDILNQLLDTLTPQERGVAQTDDFVNRLVPIAEEAVCETSRRVLDQDRMLGQLVAESLISGEGGQARHRYPKLGVGDLWLDPMLPGKKQDKTGLWYPVGSGAFSVDQSVEPLTPTTEGLNRLLTIYDRYLTPGQDLPELAEEHLLRACQYFAIVDSSAHSKSEWRRESAIEYLAWEKERGTPEEQVLTEINQANFETIALLHNPEGAQLVRENLVAFRRALDMATQSTNFNYSNTREMFEVQRQEIIEVLQGMKEKFDEYAQRTGVSETTKANAGRWSEMVELRIPREPVIIDL